MLFRATVLATFALAGCKAKPGGSCSSEGAVVCADESTQLACTSGKYVAIACKGAEGCRGKDATCDLSANAAGDACATKYEGKKLCSANRKARLRCEKGKLVSEACPGIGGCTPNTAAGTIDCDLGEPTVGETCSDDVYDQCSRDGTHTFVCVGNKWATGRPCRGKDKCTSTTARLECDVTKANDGDPCTRGEESRHTCGADERSILQCSAGRFKTASTCPEGKRCVFDASSNEKWINDTKAIALFAPNPHCE